MTIEIHNGEVYLDSQRIGYVTTVNQSVQDFTEISYLGQRFSKASNFPSNIEITMSIVAPIDVSQLMRSNITSPGPLSMGFSVNKRKNLQMEEEYLEKIDTIIHDEEE
jgi:hypothetical protein